MIVSRLNEEGHCGLVGEMILTPDLRVTGAVLSKKRQKERRAAFKADAPEVIM